jgi:putative peptide zinc metalloprotease protein
MSDDALPRLRRNLRYIPQVQDGVRVCVVKDPTSLKYFRFGEREAWLMQQMDGTHSFTQIAAALTERGGEVISAAMLEPFYRRLRELGLVERTQAERNLLLLENLRHQRAGRRQGHGNTVFRMRFSLGDPDELFNRVIGRIRFFWTPGFVVFSALVFLTYALVLATHWGAFRAGLATLYDPAQYTLGFVAMLYLSIVVIIGIHELGHGLTCKHFGGEVHEIGVMLLFFSPAFFCNVNDAWTFEKKAHRLWVTFAGPWIQLMIGGFAALVWVLSEPHTTLHQLALIAMIIGGGLSLLLNFNPLIPLDGYYALMDWLETPNLRARSFQYLGAHLKRNLLQMNVATPAVTDRERRIFLIYGSLALLYTAAILLLLVFWVSGMMVGKFGAWGWIPVGLLILTLARRMGRGAARVARVWITDKLSAARTRRLLMGAGGGALLLTLLALATPWTVQVPGVAIVEPQQRALLRPVEPGWVVAVAPEGAIIAAGEVVAVLRNPELEVAWTHARAVYQALEREASAARQRGRPDEAQRVELRLADARARYAELEQRRAALVLRAPFAAQVVTPRTNELIGSALMRGDPLVELWSTGPLRVRVQLAERDAAGVGVGSALGLKFPVVAGWTWRTRVAHQSPAAHHGTIELLAPLPPNLPEEHPLRAGMTGQARVDLERTSVAAALARGLQRTFRRDWLL